MSFLFLQMMKSEVKILSSLQGLDCVPVLYGLSKIGSNSVPCIIQEFIGNSVNFDTLTLDRAISTNTFTKRTIYRLAFNIVNAVKVILAKGVLHCDLKLDNIMVLPTTLEARIPKIKIIDFGQAVRIVDKPRFESFNLQAQQEIQNISVHVAPEVIQGKMPYNESSEIYSLGMLLLELGRGFGGFLEKLARKCTLDDCTQRPSIESLSQTLASRIRKKRY